MDTDLTEINAALAGIRDIELHALIGAHSMRYRTDIESLYGHLGKYVLRPRLELTVVRCHEVSGV
jgi:hypothetical protein